VPRHGSGEAGLTLSEVLITLSLIAIIVTAAMPSLFEAYRSACLGALSRRLAGVLFTSRAQAVLRQQSLALVFEREGDGWRCFLAEDGDGDGVRRSDLESGRDLAVGEILNLAAGAAHLGILGEGVPDPSGHGHLSGDLSDPIRAGSGDIITFTAHGTATPCSLYLTDGRGEMRVIRVYGGTSKIHLLRWKVGWPDWRRPPS
jgi:prepilin-type N-terminal cleavage/methylation domain-containing protein